MVGHIDLQCMGYKGLDWSRPTKMSAVLYREAGSHPPQCIRGTFDVPHPAEAMVVGRWMDDSGGETAWKSET